DPLLAGAKNAAGGCKLQTEIVVGAAATPCRPLIGALGLLFLRGRSRLAAVRSLAEIGDDALLRALAQHSEPDRRARREGADGPRQLRAAPDRRVVDGGDDVARGDSGFGCRAVRFRGGNERALRLLKAERLGEVGGQALELHAEPAARHRALLLELRH